jgi:PAS domain S-box-containing protein
MDILGEPKRRNRFRFLAIIILTLAYLGLAYYFRAILHSSAVYTHFAYIPFMLASLWYGRRGIGMAVLLAGFVIASDLFKIGHTDLGADLFRISSFIVFAGVISFLSEKLSASQRALSDSELKYRRIIEKTPDGIFLYRENIILFANTTLYQILEYEPPELVGRSIWEFIYTADQPMVRDLLGKRERGDVVDLVYTCRLIKKSGQTIWVRVSSTTTQYEEKDAILVHLLDITREKQADMEREKLEELTKKQEEQLVHSTKLAELGEMAASVAHELNQPLTGIRNFAKNAIYMINENAGTIDEVKVNLDLISQQVDRSTKIINQMRALARRSDKQFEPVDINKIVKDIAEFMSPQLRLSRVEVELHFPQDLPIVMGDKLKLEQVFLNLISNARQAMEESEVRRLTIKTSHADDGDRYVGIEISDTGKGFSPENTENLFKPFYTTKKIGQGTGLGLSVTLSIIKEHNGTIEAFGMSGKGATFLVRLPVLRWM